MAFAPSTWLAFAGYACLPVALLHHRRSVKCWPIVFLTLCAGLLRFSASLDSDLHEWDERYHALVAKHLVEHPLRPTLYDDARLPHEAGSWAHGHVWLNKPPLPLWAIAASIATFGTEPWAVRLPSVLLSMLATVLLYQLVRERVSRNVALWSAMLFAMNGHLVELASGRTSNDHPDTFLVCMVLAALFAASRTALKNSALWASLAGFLGGLAFMSKMWPSLLVPLVAVGFLIAQRTLPWRRKLGLFGVLMVLGSLVSVPWFCYVQWHFPEVAAAASAAHWQHFTVGLEDHARPWYYYFAQLPMIHGEAAPVAVVWFLAFPLRTAWRQHLPWALWMIVPFLVFSCAVTKMPGYTAIAVPAICVVICMTFDQAMTSTATRSSTRIALRVVAALLVVLPLRFSWDRVRPLKPAPPRYDAEELAHGMMENTIVMGSEHPIELMFHSPIAGAYSFTLPDTTIQRLERSGFVVLGAPSVHSPTDQ
ncbi:MAG: glycosyltransferase family 39 protein [Flavobacteriales bacterium]|nr:MAG: glycosyltransferase family 39 protein [Flavobacteriales bacterium]